MEFFNLFKSLFVQIIVIFGIFSALSEHPNIAHNRGSARIRTPPRIPKISLIGYFSFFLF